MGARRPARASRPLVVLMIIAVALGTAASIVTWLPRPSPWTSNPGGSSTAGVSPCGWAWAPSPAVLVDLPAGATTMWICDGASRLPLTQSIQSVVDRIRAQPEMEWRSTCITWASTGVVFLDYPDGSRVGFSWADCEQGGIAGRQNPGEMAASINAAYRAQYGDPQSDADDDLNPCRPRQYTQVVSPSVSLESLTLCRGRLTAAAGASQTTAVPLTPGDVVRVVTGWTKPGDGNKEWNDEAPPADAILLRGLFPQPMAPDTATLWWSGDQIWTSGGNPEVRQITPGARAILERYLGGKEPEAPSTPGPLALAGESPCGAPPAYVVGPPPDGPVAAWFCNDPVLGVEIPPVPDPLTLDPQALVDVLAGLPVPDPNMFGHCKMDPGPGFDVVLRYPDRDVTVSGGLYECHYVGGHYRADEFVAAFATLLAHQRRTVPPPSVSLPSAPPTPRSRLSEPGVFPCQGWDAWMPGRLDQVTSLVRCDQGEVVETLPASLLDDMRTHSSPTLTRFPPHQEQTKLVAVAPDGSVIQVYWDGTHGWYPINGQWYRWRPSAAAKAALP